MKQSILAPIDVSDTLICLTGVFEATTVLMILMDANGLILRANPAVEKVSGYRQEEITGRRLQDFLAEPAEEHQNQGALLPISEKYLARDQRNIWIQWSAAPLAGDIDGQICYLATGIDTTVQRQAEEHLRQNENRARILAEISQSLADASLDYQAVLDAIVTPISTLIGDLAVVQVLSEDRTEIYTGAVRHVNPHLDERARTALLPVRQPAGEGLAARVIQTGLPVVIQDLPQEKMSQVDNPDWLPFLPGEPGESHNLLIVPLRAHSEIFGTLALSRGTPGRAYTVEDLNFVFGLADRAALAIDNARLYSDNLCQRDELELRVARRTAEISVINQYLQLQLGERRRLEEELALFFDVSQDMLCLTDLDGCFTRVNPSWTKTLGWSEDELLGQPFIDLVHPNDREATIQTSSALLTGTSVHQFDNRCRCKDGSYRWISWNSIGVPERGVVIAAARDISQRKQAEQRVADLLEFNQTIIANAPVGIYVYRPSGECVLTNESGARIVGAPVEQVLAQNFNQIPSWQRTGMLKMAEDALSSGKEQQAELHIISSFSQEAWLDCFLTRFHSGDENHLLLMTNDITSRKKIEDELQYMATHDALTGLPNRHLFQDRLDLSLARARRNSARVAVMLLDLDHFKQINDTYGHQTGDLVLKVVSERLMGCLRKSDTVARMGGDEFTFIFPDLPDPQHAQVIAAKILAAVSQPIDLGVVQYTPTASLGISLFPPHGLDPETLLKNADIAMYEAKQERNCFCLFTELQPESIAA
jgi:diguanylate cyclase (GGDEF)-like protein/PAS domain S-box-containing protein